MVPTTVYAAVSAALKLVTNVATRSPSNRSVAAVDSCVTALCLALSFLHQPFESLLSFVAECGGDVDTIGSMAGAIWGASNGESGLPAAALERLEARARIQSVAEALYRSASSQAR